MNSTPLSHSFLPHSITTFDQYPHFSHTFPLLLLLSKIYPLSIPTHSVLYWPSFSSPLDISMFLFRCHFTFNLLKSLPISPLSLPIYLFFLSHIFLFHLLYLRPTHPKSLPSPPLLLTPSYPTSHMRRLYEVFPHLICHSQPFICFRRPLPLTSTFLHTIPCISQTLSSISMLYHYPPPPITIPFAKIILIGCFREGLLNCCFDSIFIESRF